MSSINFVYQNLGHVDGKYVLMDCLQTAFKIDGLKFVHMMCMDGFPAVTTGDLT